MKNITTIILGDNLTNAGLAHMKNITNIKLLPATNKRKLNFKYC